MTALHPFTLAILGCGAVVQELHAQVLPALSPPIDVRLCVDVNGDRAKQVATLVGGTAVQGGLDELLNHPRTDGVLVALPNALQAQASIACMLNGRHVFCEKPAATSQTECQQLAQTLAQANRVFSVNLLRRFLPATIALRRLVEESALGVLARADVDEGGAGWPSRSGFQFVRSIACGGVTLDRGPHVFDLLHGVLGEPLVESYLDDATGGVEATSVTSLRWPIGCLGHIRISKLEPWAARATLTGKDGTRAIWALNDPTAVRMFDRSGKELARRNGPPPTRHFPSPLLEALHTILTSWVGACRGTSPNPTPFADVRAICGLIQSCYRLRRPLALEWESFAV